MITQEQFENAVRDTKYRQQFLQELDLGEAGKYVKKVIYEKRQDLYRDGQIRIMCTSPPIRTLFNIPGGRSKVLVFPLAFSDYHTRADDFLNSLADHEILGHARLAFEGRTNYFPFSLVAEEISVLRNQIELMKKRNCSEEHKLKVADRLARYLREYRWQVSVFNLGRDKEKNFAFEKAE
jgi:hypothetical protein